MGKRVVLWQKALDTLIERTKAAAVHQVVFYLKLYEPSRGAA